MKWVAKYRKHTLEVGGYQVAVISGGFAQDVKWTGNILLPTKASTSWKETTGSLEEQKATIERAVRVWFSKTAIDLDLVE